MLRYHKTQLFLLTTGFLLSSAIAFAQDGSKMGTMMPTASERIEVMKKEGVGSYLVDGKGRTLYWFTKDMPGKSTCSKDCLQKWPAVTASAIEPAEGLNAKDFSMLSREDGTKQVTYKGYPLYTFFQDKEKGDTMGQGVNNVWYVIDPATFPKMP